MTDEEMAEEYKESRRLHDIPKERHLMVSQEERLNELKQAFLAGLKAGRPQWHKIFKGDPYCVEYWDLPQDTLPKNENFYFVKLKNGFIKICELKYDHWSRKKYFCDLHGGKQSNVAEWLDYPTFDKE